MENQTKIPQLRFPEFNGEWEKKKLGEVTEINPQNKTLPKSFIYIDLESVTNGELLKETEISRDEAPSRAQRILKENDVLFQMVRPYQMNNLFFNKEGDYVASTGYAQIRTLQNSKYIFQYLHFQKFVDNVIERCTGTSYPAINSTDLSNIEISFPTLPEQTKIATFLTAIDAKLQALKKKKSLLEHYKKGVMQRLFLSELGLVGLEDDKINEDIKNKVNNPTILKSKKSKFRQLRFKDEDGKEFADWEVKKLGEVAKRITLKNKEGNTNVLTISAQFGLISQLEFFNKSVSAKDVTGYYLLENGDFAYNKSYSNGYPMGAIKCLNRYEKGVVSTLYICFKFNEEVNNSFMEHFFETGIHNSEIEKVAQEGARNHGLLNIGLDDFFNIEISIPSLPEQTAIANFLSALDEKINHTNTQIQNAEAWKKGLLQKMFC